MSKRPESGSGDRRNKNDAGITASLGGKIQLSGMNDAGHSRLKWHCRRGMRELDVLLEKYLARRYEDAPPVEQAAFETLLSLQDPEILDLITGRVIAEDVDLRDVVKRLLTDS
jgi:antitoxin CptB